MHVAWVQLASDRHTWKVSIFYTCCAKEVCLSSDKKQLWTFIVTSIQQWKVPFKEAEVEENRIALGLWFSQI